MNILTEPRARLSIVVPAYNEAETIARVLQSLIDSVPFVHEIIVVDDGSTDETANLAERFSDRYGAVRLIRCPRNRGKTAAVRDGFAASTGDIVIVQDADLEYDPRDIPCLVQPIIDGQADVVYGSRFLVKRAARVLYYRHYLANQILTTLSNVLTDLNLTDVETGYKVFRGDVIRSMVIEASGFGFEIEVTAKIAKARCRVYEVPISYHGRTYEEGKKIGLVDGFHALWYVLKFNCLCGMKASFTRLPMPEMNQVQQI